MDTHGDWTVTTRRKDYSVQTQRPAQVLACQRPPKPTDLIRGLEERVIAKDIRVLTLDDVLDVADRRRRDGADSLDVLRNEQKVVGIDVAVFDEPPRLFG